MAIPTIAQSLNPPFVFGPVASTTGTYGGAQTEGNSDLVIAGYGYTTGSDPGVSCSDTNNGSYDLVDFVNDPVNQFSVATFCRKNIHAAAPGTNVVTVLWGSDSAQFLEIVLFEIQGSSPTIPVDQARGAIGSSTTPSSGPVTTENTQELAIGYCNSGPDATGAGAGWTSFDATGSPGGGITNSGGWLETRPVPYGASLAATFTANNGPWIAIVTTLQPSATAGVHDFGSDT